MSVQEIQWIIARTGGADGTSLLHQSSIELLKSIGIKTTTTTGIVETDLGITEQDLKERPNIISELNFSHPTSKKLYDNSFKNAKLPKGTWLAEHDFLTKTIKQELEKVIYKQTPVIIHNLVSLREFHPQAAIALRELIETNPHIPFVSYAADSSYERPERTSKMQQFVLQQVLGSSRGIDSLGPYNFDNLYHIVLNKEQEDTFTKQYKIPKDKVFRLPDFLPFEQRNPPEFDKPNFNFIEKLSQNCVTLEDRVLQFNAGDIDEKTTYFITPVRPIERKKIKTAIFIAHQYQKETKKRAALVITHPNKDEGGDYFYECVNLSQKLDVPLVYLGENLQLKGPNSLWHSYQEITNLNSIGLVLSSKGGWENAINECVKSCIPVYMNPGLPSFRELQDLGFNIRASNLSRINEVTAQTTKLKDLTFPEVHKVINWIEYATSKKGKASIAEQNYEAGYRSLSSESRTPTFLEILSATYKGI